MRRLLHTLLPGRPLAAAALVVALAAVAGFALGDGHVTPARAATKYTASAGGGRGGISVDAFMPRVINVNQGDTVEFVNPFEEIHTVTFLGSEKLPDLIEARPGVSPTAPPKLVINPKASNPVPASGTANLDGTAFANSGILAKGSPATSWSVTFPKLGSFELVCIVHPFMTAQVNVLSPGIFVASQAQRDAEASRQLEAALRQGEGIAAAARPAKTANANGTSTWDVLTPGAPPGIAINRFAPARISIGVGDTVVWKNDNPGPPHTVTFTSGGPVPSFPGVEPQSSGPPLLTIPQNVGFPVKPSQNYDGTGYYNSGIIESGPEATGGTSFALTFTKAGTYPYICVLHASQGMAGVVEVGGAGGGITPPSTGEAGLAGDASRASGWTLAGVTLLLLAFGASFVAFRRHA